MMHPPSSLQGILWSTDVNLLDCELDKPYIIHQTLAYGRMEDIRWLFRTYPVGEIRRVFTEDPYKDYRAARFSLIKNHVLNISIPMEEKRYVKNIPRDL